MLWNRTSLFSVVPLGRGRPMTTFKVTHCSELFSCIRQTAAWSDLCIPCCQIHKWILLTLKSYFTQTFSYVTISMFSTEHWTQMFQTSNLRWPSNFQKGNTPLPQRKKHFRVYFCCLCLMIQRDLLQQCLKPTQPWFCKPTPAGGPINLNINSYRINANFLVWDGKIPSSVYKMPSWLKSQADINFIAAQHGMY